MVSFDEMCILVYMCQGGGGSYVDHTTTFTTQTHTCTHCQTGLTALKVAAHRDVCDILLQYSQRGAKVSSAEQEESDSRKEEETKAELAEVGMMTTGDER